MAGVYRVKAYYDDTKAYYDDTRDSDSVYFFVPRVVGTKAINGSIIVFKAHDGNKCAVASIDDIELVDISRLELRLRPPAKVTVEKMFKRTIVCKVYDEVVDISDEFDRDYLVISKAAAQDAQTESTDALA